VLNKYDFFKIGIKYAFYNYVESSRISYLI
jgi:hypothetical protein